MARFFGRIGFVDTYESSPGVWSERTIAPTYYGDVLSDRRRYNSGESINDNIVLVNYISVVGDTFMLENYHTMKWVEYKDCKWAITAVELEYPRVKINFGGLWNE